MGNESSHPVAFLVLALFALLVVLMVVWLAPQISAAVNGLRSLSYVSQTANLAVQRTAQTESHLMARHGATALGALLAVKACPSLLVYFCPATGTRTDAYAVGCGLEDGRCAVCIIGMDGVLRTCFVRRDCKINGCMDIPNPPKFYFPAACPPGERHQGCITPDDFEDPSQYLFNTITDQ